MKQSPVVYLDGALPSIASAANYRSILFRSGGPQPSLASDFHHKRRIDVGLNQFLKSELNLIIFGRQRLSPVLGETSNRERVTKLFSDPSRMPDRHRCNNAARATHVHLQMY